MSQHGDSSPRLAATRSYADAGRCGFALGLVLLASFVITGRGLGASGAFATAAGNTLEFLGLSQAVERTPALADRLPLGASLLNDWIVLEVAGVMVGGALSAWLAGRWWRPRRDATPGSAWRQVAGGALMGLGARLAYGCTSGLGLSGGALMVTGAWVFIAGAFGTAMLVTLLASRRLRGEP